MTPMRAGIMARNLLGLFVGNFYLKENWNMTMNALKNIGTIAIAAGLLGLGGCAQLQSFGNSMWSGTKNFSNGSARKVSSLLRPAPKQIERFETKQIPDTMVADFMRRYAVPNVENTPTLSAMNHTRESGVNIYRPSPQRASNYIQVGPSYQAPQSIIREQIMPPALRPASNPDHLAGPGEQLAGAAPTPSAPQNASYVKTGGGANMADWQACQTKAGNIYLAAGNSYIINPKFDACMRAHGYLPESEAVARLQ